MQVKQSNFKAFQALQSKSKHLKAPHSNSSVFKDFQHPWEPWMSFESSWDTSRKRSRRVSEPSFWPLVRAAQTNWPPSLAWTENNEIKTKLVNVVFSALANAGDWLKVLDISLFLSTFSNTSGAWKHGNCAKALIPMEEITNVIYTLLRCSNRADQWCRRGGNTGGKTRNKTCTYSL